MAGERGVDRRWDVVDQAVARQRGRKTQRCGGSPNDDLDQVGVGREIRLDEDPPGKLFDAALISPAVQDAIGHPAGARSGMSEDRRHVVMDWLAATYEFRRHPFCPARLPDATMVRIEIDRIRGVGPWADTAETTVAESV